MDGLATVLAYAALASTCISSDMAWRDVLAVAGYAALILSRLGPEERRADTGMAGNFLLLGSLSFATPLHALWLMAFLMNHVLATAQGGALTAVFHALMTQHARSAEEFTARVVLATVQCCA